MFKKHRACNTPLARCFQDLSNGILQAPKFLKPKTKSAVV
jgi:hypothetical protein